MDFVLNIVEARVAVAAQWGAIRTICEAVAI
jgi:hypothetical protein